MSKISNMSNKGLSSSNATKFRSAGNFVGYLLRGGETGLSCCTSLMTDDNFLHQLDALYEKQKSEFYTEFSPKTLEYWKNRDFDMERKVEAEKLAADPNYKVKNLDRSEQKRNVIVRKDAAFRSKPWHVRGGSEKAQSITDIAHKISVTQIYDQVQGRTGHQVMQMLPNDANKEQILHVINAMRNAVPKDHAAVFTVHKDINKHNLHIQGWISSKDWDSATGKWKEHSRNNQRYFETKAAPKAFHDICQTAMVEANLKFKHADDNS